eukprot:m.97863 g.97863  ORF g.97863 m.97863 type:complete len:155 (+) comp13112_c0_seq3:45-509(+)
MGALRGLRIGCHMQPPTLVIDYVVLATGKRRRRKIPINKDNEVADILSELRKRHAKYTSLVPAQALERMVEKLVGAPIKQATTKEQAPPTVDGDLDLNALTDEELQQHKAAMDADFMKNQLKPGDPGYQHDVQVEFKPTEKTDWDDDSEESDDW